MTFVTLRVGIVVLKDIFVRSWALEYIDRPDAGWIPDDHVKQVLVLEGGVGKKLAGFVGAVLEHVAVGAQ